MPPHGADRAQLQTALTGTVAIAFIFCLSRWGTTFGVAPLYLTDALLGLAIVNAAFTHRPASSFGPALARPGFRSLPLVHWLLLADVVLRFVTSFDASVASDWIRDAVPYLYGFIALLSVTSFRASTAQRRDRTARILVGALVLHLVWTSVVMLTPLGSDFALKATVGGAPLFQVRPDIDAALNAVLAGLCLRSALRKQHLLLAIIGLLASCGLVLSLATRAGTISLIVVLVVSFGLTYGRTPRTKSRGWLVLIAGFLLLAAVAVLPTTTPGQRILATLVPDTASTAQDFNAQGTAEARNLVWTGVIDWTLETPGRAIVGSGFGNDFLAESHTLQYLEGTTYTGVRSPHDYFIGTFARLGLIGVLLVVGCLLVGLVTMVRRRYDIANDALSSIAATTVIALIPIASLGVVLESPFGAVPLFWCLGIVYAYRGERSTEDAAAEHTALDRPASTPRRLSASR